MADIKSTLELAMERTKKMTISEKEKEEIKRKEIEHKVDALSNRYRDGHLPLTEVLKEIERMDERVQTTARESMLSQWIDGLSMNNQDERLLKGIESLKHRSLDELKQRHHQLISQYQKEKERIKEEARAQLVEILREDGIYGSAVEPNTEAHHLWKQALEKLNQLYRSKLEDIKEQLRSL